MLSSRSFTCFCTTGARFDRREVLLRSDLLLGGGDSLDSLSSSVSIAAFLTGFLRLVALALSSIICNRARRSMTSSAICLLVVLAAGFLTSFSASAIFTRLVTGVGVGAVVGGASSLALS